MAVGILFPESNTRPQAKPTLFQPVKPPGFKHGSLVFKTNSFCVLLVFELGLRLIMDN